MGQIISNQNLHLYYYRYSFLLVKYHWAFILLGFFITLVLSGVGFVKQPLPSFLDPKRVNLEKNLKHLKKNLEIIFFYKGVWRPGWRNSYKSAYCVEERQHRAHQVSRAHTRRVWESQKGQQVRRFGARLRLLRLGLGRGAQRLRVWREGEVSGGERRAWRLGGRGQIKSVKIQETPRLIAWACRPHTRLRRTHQFEIGHLAR